MDIFRSHPFLYMDSPRRTTLAEPGKLGVRFGFPEPYEVFNLRSTAKTLHNSKIYKQIYTTTLKRQLKYHTLNAFRSLTAAMEEGTNQTSQQSRKRWIFRI